ncbi:LamG-like jellyroll fold domain-containing protein [Candidatus Sororendozoicomonas aggregata]|uniref:LamG-like jellyroll fold domain-containing protein n=1 Tax=Candidatus Sororendozoicomonas aggregata TaxID=3073239 RepID=UPI002ED33D5E
MNTHLHKQAGLSLMEVLVSSVLLTMIFLWISESHIRSLSDIAETSQRTQVVWRIEELAERIKMTPLLESYKNEVNGVSNVSSYCNRRANCRGARCSSSEMVKFDVQKVYCATDNINDLDLSLDCFDTRSGSRLSNCASRGTVRIRITASWKPKGRFRDRLSADTEFSLSLNQSLFFDGNDYLTATGALFDGSRFTIAMWVKPSATGGFRGFFGLHDGSGNRAPSLWVYGSQLHYDSYKRILLGGLLGIVPDRYSGVIPGYFVSGQWTHVAWVKKENDYFFYKDGVLQRRVTGIADYLTDKGEFTIGKVDNSFTGEIDDVQFYNAFLSATQIGLIMEGRSFPEMNMTLHLDFEGDSLSDALRDGSSVGRSVTSSGISDSSRRHVVR